jgi:D-3-phosphoglycerate dehydrogenase
MYKIKCLNKISSVGTDKLGENYTFGADVDNPDGILVRSASMLDMEFGSELLAIARAGAGVNNIPLDRCSEKGIVVFNTPGANANAVKELVLCALFLTSRKIIPGEKWVQTLKGKGSEIGKLVEKGKSSFAGPEIKGKALGVIGLGAIGRLVANAAKSLGMEVYGYDPFLSVEAAWGLSRSVHHAHSLDEIYAACDYITIHVPYTEDTKNLVSAEAIGKMKDGVRILNFARDGLVNTEAVLEGLKSGKVSAYATDFATESLLGVDGVTALPHLGASTPESEDNCAEMAANEIKEYLENGNILNSVNMPSISMPRSSNTRICLLHKNIPNTIGEFANVCGEAGINIENMLSKSRGDYAYTILDVSGDVNESNIQGLKQNEKIIRVRLLK